MKARRRSVSPRGRPPGRHQVREVLGAETDVSEPVEPVGGESAACRIKDFTAMVREDLQEDTRGLGREAPKITHSLVGYEYRDLSSLPFNPEVNAFPSQVDRGADDVGTSGA